MIEQFLIGLVAKVAPWLPTLPTAWLVYERTQRYLGWPNWVAIAAGAAIELLGVSILATTLELYAYNSSKRKSDPEAIMWVPAFLVVVYLGSAILLTAMLDIIPELSRLAPAICPLLSAAAMTVLGLRYNHQQRLVAIRDKDEERRAQREQAKAQKVQEQVVQVQGETYGEQALGLHGQYPDWTKTRIAQEIGCSVSTVSRALQNNGNHHG